MCEDKVSIQRERKFHPKFHNPLTVLTPPAHPPRKNCFQYIYNTFYVFFFVEFSLFYGNWKNL